MNILSLFVVIPVLMLLGLWIARNVNQVRGVMVAGSSCLLAMSVWLTLHFISERAGGNTEEMILHASTAWFPALHINYEVGVDGISVVMLLLSSIIVFTGTFASWKLKPLTKEFFMWFTLLSISSRVMPSDGAPFLNSQGGCRRQQQECRRCDTRPSWRAHL